MFKRAERQRLVEVEQRLRERMKGHHALHRVVEVAPWHPAPEMRAVQVPIDPSGSDAIRPLYPPKPVDVLEGTERQPVSVLMGRRWEPVTRISDRWTFDLWWLPRPVSRTYYRIDQDGRQVTLFLDHANGLWYKQSA